LIDVFGEELHDIFGFIFFGVDHHAKDIGALGHISNATIGKDIFPFILGLERTEFVGNFELAGDRGSNFVVKRCF
jgi:hypothetical protein